MRLYRLHPVALGPSYAIGKSRLHKAPRNREFHSRVGVRLSAAIYIPDWHKHELSSYTENLVYGGFYECPQERVSKNPSGLGYRSQKIKMFI